MKSSTLITLLSVNTLALAGYRDGTEEAQSIIEDCHKTECCTEHLNEIGGPTLYKSLTRMNKVFGGAELGFILGTSYTIFQPFFQPSEDGAIERTFLGGACAMTMFYLEQRTRTDLPINCEDSTQDQDLEPVEFYQLKPSAR